jgi:hypothetical protein
MQPSNSVACVCLLGALALAACHGASPESSDHQALDASVDSTSRALESGVPEPSVTLTVTTLDDDGPGSLRAALAEAEANMRIVFDDGLEGSLELESPLVGPELSSEAWLFIDGPGADLHRVLGLRPAARADHP